MIYQEQVMQIAQVLAGYSLGSADLLRRAMGKKIPAEMEAQRQLFIEGAAARGVDGGLADHIFDQMAKFAGYGFNKSHAAAYALVAYQTAYLKANYPVEFLAALMTLDLGNTDKLNIFRQELDRLGIRLLPPDINRSEVTFAVESDPKSGNPAIRYALAAVKGVGGQAMSELVAERTANGRFKDLIDFARRLDAKSFNRRQFENLAKAGAFDSLNPNRAQTFAAAEQLLRQASLAAEERESRQESLFGKLDPSFAPAPGLAAGRRLAAGRAAPARVRRDRLLPVEPSARPLRQEPRTRRRDPLRRTAGGCWRRTTRPASSSPASSSAARSAPRRAATGSPSSRCRIRAASSRSPCSRRR